MYEMKKLIKKKKLQLLDFCVFLLNIKKKKSDSICYQVVLILSCTEMLIGQWVNPVNCVLGVPKCKEYFKKV